MIECFAISENFTCASACMGLIFTLKVLEVFERKIKKFHLLKKIVYLLNIKNKASMHMFSRLTTQVFQKKKPIYL